MENKKTLLIVSAVVAVLAVGGIILAVSGGKEKSSDENKDKMSTVTPTTKTNGEATSTPTTEAKNIVRIDNACAVFSAKDIEAATGIKVGEGDNSGYKTVYNSDNLPINQCEWEQNNGDTASDFTFNITTRTFADETKAQTDINNSKITAGSLTFEQLSGVADDAIYARSGSAEKKVQAQIYWKSDNVIYHFTAVRLNGLDRDAVEAQLKKLVESKF